MIFAAKEAVERRAMEKGMERGLEKGIERGREQGVQEGGQAERKRIEQILKEYGVHIPPEAARRIDRKDP